RNGVIVVPRHTRRRFLIFTGLMGIGGLVAWCFQRRQRNRSNPEPQPFITGTPMQAGDWRLFLEQYSLELLATDDERIKIPAAARDSQWMGYPPATEAAIEAAERRLGRQLPPSLRTFYAVTNGWRSTGFFIWDVLPVEQLGWLRDREPQL